MFLTVDYGIVKRGSTVTRMPPYSKGRVSGSGGGLPLILMASVVTFFLLRLAVLDVWRVEGSSMVPVLQPGQLILVNKLAYGLRVGKAYLVRWSQPSRGDLVVFRSPVEGRVAVKRCVAVAGDSMRPEWGLGTARVPAGRIVVLGANPADSIDSRAFGPVPADSVLAKVAMR